MNCTAPELKLVYDFKFLFQFLTLNNMDLFNLVSLYLFMEKSNLRNNFKQSILYIKVRF